MKKKGAVIGIGLEFFPVMSLILIIGIIFLLLSSGAWIFNTPMKPESSTLILPQKTISTQILFELIIYKTWGLTSETTNENTIIQAILEATINEGASQELAKQIDQGTFQSEEEKKLAVQERLRLSNHPANVKIAIKTKLEKLNSNSKETKCFVIFQGIIPNMNNIKTEGNGKDIYFKIDNGVVKQRYVREEIIELYEKNKMESLALEMQNKKTGKISNFKIKYYYGACENE